MFVPDTQAADAAGARRRAPTGPIHPKSFDAGARGPLAGVRVVDLSRLMAGNMLSVQLADFGADVVKVESERGDTLRAVGAGGVSTNWKVYGRNKRSVCVDLRAPEGLDIVRGLVRDADVFVESFKPGVAEKMGLGPDALLAIRPQLVIARISGWGQTGPFRHKPGFGTLAEGYAGFAAINGFADREPVLPPMFLGDMTAGLSGAIAVLVALHARDAQGVAGQVIDVSLFEPLLSILGPAAANYALTGQVKARTGSRSSNTAPRNAYRTRDGKWLCLSSSTQAMAERLFHAIGRADLIDDPRYATNVQRVQHAEALDAIVGAFIGARDLDANLAFFEEAGVTAGPIHDIAQIVADHYVIEREALVELPDDDVGSLPMHNITPRLSATPGTFRRPAPALGEHNREILLPLLGEREYERLAGLGVIRSQ
ncbi:CoA transferase [Burkholderia stagnalis]|uniref:CoA transferase n=1 Tax=Burkholderia stagnalis TaxID=1503054 RepID=A0A104UWM0_9BURK|nr:CoA transferase [Burkholderia stagnalis]KVD89343.1 acyl-CoA transferase [Burkholderia stagnalis]KVN19968.1 acyl-CoA transferase [Burkholderia stagnalis]KVN27076.1 acyl-CoA transferase [Burkholderia stagnalis]KVO61272.1 acyl-CoA transferase [Burkholderia stagnalis]KVP12876.1 acyl-CoA transferase [Burkholderia stagnalis]